jgi:P-type Cu+ transporter
MANASLRRSALRPSESRVSSLAPAEPSAPRCPGCASEVDPLRAGHVAFLEGAFRYFCGADCKRAYLRTEGRAQEESVETMRPPDVADASDGADRQVPSHIRPKALLVAEPPLADARLAEAPRADVRVGVGAPDGDASALEVHSRASDLDEDQSIEPAPDTLPSPGTAGRAVERSGLRSHVRRDAFAVLDALGIVCGVLVPAAFLLGPSFDRARLPLAIASWAALVVRLASRGRDPSDPHPLVVALPTAGAVVAACWAAAIGDPRAVALTIFAALSSAVATIVEVLIERPRGRLRAARERISSALDLHVRALQGEDQVDLHASEVRPGEQIVVLQDELVGVDATVTAGEARVIPWLDAPIELIRREGDPVLAGARVVSSQLRMTTTWSGDDRAWIRLLSPRATRIDVAAPTARAVRHTVERGAPLAAIVVGLAAFSANAPPFEVLAVMCAGAMAFGAKAACSYVALHFGRAHLEALTNGIAYKHARAFERAGSASLAVLSARGTVLMGEPEIVAIEPVGAFDVERLLSLAAGAETATTHPFAAAILRAARMRGVRPEHVRNVTAHAGLGITALASAGERLVIGGRAIMLEQKIGVAVTDARVSELEAQGRSVLLVALGDRLIGIIALQDGLRPAARAAVQRLLDARIEPVLLSGEARETCETIGRALDIEHVRPEVLPADRGAEVRALAEGGGIVAVIGHPAGDDGALGAADVAVAMGAAGSTAGDWAVVIASDDVRDAALALAIPHTARDRARMAILLGATPGLVALLAIGFGVAPVAVAPIAALIGVLAVAAHAREGMTVSSARGAHA